MHGAGRRFALLALALAMAGCAGYQPRPLVPRDVLEELQRVRLDALRPARPVAGEPDTAAPTLDPARGLSANQAVAVALFLNPDVRTFRAERGVAEGELVASRLLPNPELEITWLHLENFTRSLATGGWDIGLSWAPPRPGERSARVARAQARIAGVRAQVADEEWRLATEVRKAFATLWAAGERRRLTEASIALQERLLRFLRDRLQLGDASRLEVNLLALDYAERRRELTAAENAQVRARLDFNRLLGLPPALDVALAPPGDPLAYRPFTLDPAALESTMVEWRPDLATARQEYEQAEQELRLAYIQRIPWFRFGPAYEREEGINKIGIGIAIDLPIANLNQGEIARLEAVRAKQADAFLARVHAARAEMHAALRELQGQERLVRLYDEVVRPAVEENEQLTAAALELGDVNVLQFVTAQDKVLRSRGELLETLLEYWKAVFDLERALGTPLVGAERRKE